MLLISQIQVLILPDSDKKTYIPILVLRLNPCLVPEQGLQKHCQNTDPVFSEIKWRIRLT